MRILKYTFEHNGEKFVGFAKSFEEARKIARSRLHPYDYHWRRKSNYTEVIYNFDPCTQNVLEMIEVAVTASKDASPVRLPGVECQNVYHTVHSKPGGSQAERVSIGSQIQ